MAFNKKKESDPTQAFLLNGRQQKLLLIQLEKIDKMWYKRLKHLSKDRLEATTDLVRLEDEKQQLQYYDQHMEVHKMKDYNDECIKQMRHLKRELTHDNFNFDSTAFAERKRSMVHQNGATCLPKININRCFVTQTEKKRGKGKGNKRGQSRRQSNLMKHRILSVSDSNIDRVSKHIDTYSLGDRSKTFSMSHEDLISAARVNSFIAKLVEDQAEPASTSPVLPTINTKPDEHRYLKQRMATTLVLPTVTEVETRQRKISI